MKLVLFTHTCKIMGERYTVKLKFRNEILRKCPNFDKSQTLFSFAEVMQHFIYYIMTNKDKFLNAEQNGWLTVQNDALRKLFEVESFHQSQIRALVHQQLIPYRLKAVQSRKRTHSGRRLYVE